MPPAGRLRLFQKVEQKYGGRIADLFGIQQRGVQFDIGKVPGKSVAVTQGQRITFDRDYLQNASRSDIRGATIHELTHAYGMGGDAKGKPGKVETYADYARAVLNRNDPGWSPSREVREMLERRGDMANNAGSNGPRAGAGTGRNRDTTVNNASKQTPYNPYLSVGGAFGAASDLAAARYQQLLQLAQLKAQKSALKGQFMEGRATARADQVAGMADAVNTSLESGGFGSSVDFQARAGVDAAKVAEMNRLKQERALGKMGLQTEKLGINAEYAQTVAGIQQSMAEERLASLMEQFGLNTAGASGVDYKSILKKLLDQKNGNSPRRRSGLTPPMPPAPRRY
jgi:hypothetical protein